MCFTAEAEREIKTGARAAGSLPQKPLTCLPGTFGDSRRLLEEVGDCGLSDFQVVGSVRLRGECENMKSIGPQEKHELSALLQP